MTVQEAIKKIISSEDLKKKAIEALKAGKGDEFLKEHGIDITVDQIKEAFKKNELTKTELDMATGGNSGVVMPPGIPFDLCDNMSSINPGDFNCVFKIN